VTSREERSHDRPDRLPDLTCRAPARIVDRWSWGSSDGPVEHVKTLCERGHWFTPAADSLDFQVAAAAAGQVPVSVA
jgi:hypothetical protein